MTKMVSLPGLLIEHLISGSITMLWLFIAYPDKFQKGDIQHLGLFLVPVAYILGMFVDFVAFWLTSPVKQKVRKAAQNKHDRQPDSVLYNEGQAKKVKALIEHRYKDTQNQIDMRGSRDRIARGMIVNSLCILFLMPDTILNLPLKISLVVFSIVTWIFFEYISYRYFLRAYNSLAIEGTKPGGP